MMEEGHQHIIGVKLEMASKMQILRNKLFVKFDILWPTLQTITEFL